MTRDTVVQISYHVNWPGPSDGFYLWNAAESHTRWTYYGVNGVPAGFVDGIYTEQGSATGLRSQIRQRRNMAAPCTMTLTAMAAGTDSVHVTGTITATDTALNNAKLFLALVTDVVHYSSPPGTNGETIFPNPFRDMAPNTAGQPVTLALGASYDIDMMLHKDASWNADSLVVVGFLQNSTTKWVHQAAWAHVYNPWAINHNCSDPRQLIAATNTETVYTIYLQNGGTNNDTYTVTVGGAPSGWTQGIEATGVPLDPQSISVPLTHGMSTWLTYHVNPNGIPGSGDFSVTIASQGNDTLVVHENFRLLAGLQVLLVDDDGGPNPGPGEYDSYYLNSLQTVSWNRPWGVWDSQISALDQSQLSQVPMVIWYTGSRPNNQTLNAEDLTLIEGYLGGGGKLFLTGQGIAFDLRLNPFLANVLHVTHTGPYPGVHPVEGISGNYISDGLNPALNGGDGANNQTRPNKIKPADASATPLWRWPGIGGDTCAAVTVESGNSKIVFLAFGFEAISTQGERDTVMFRVLNWLLGPAAADSRENLRPTEYLLGQNYPNPFNPETVIPYVLPARAEVSLRIFDVLGREVAVLVSGPQEAGIHAVTWNAASLSSGLYFCRLDASSGNNAYHAARKLMLLK